MKTKVCKMCKIEKPVTEFWKSKRLKDGLYSTCKECSKEKQNKTYCKNHLYDKDIKWVQAVEKFKTTKKDLINDGSICSECGVRFERAHGEKVICPDCVRHYQVRDGINRVENVPVSWIKEIEPVGGLLCDKYEYNLINGRPKNMRGLSKNNNKKKLNKNKMKES